MAASSLLLYLLKANGALLLVAAAYFGLLRRLTFFTLNRAYLLLGILFAAVYPALPMPALLPAEATPTLAFAVIAATGAAGAVAAPATPPMNWAAVGVALYAAGAAVLLARLLGQLLSLARLRRQSRPALVQGQPVRVLAGKVSPFSFGRSIYLNPALHPAPELAAVLRHEQVHVRQRHTLDVLLAQLALAAAWCNPAAWLLRRALLDNLEFLADQAVLETGLDRRAYQYSLLRLSQAPAGPSLVSSFTFPTLKTRVMMMNMPLSSSGQLARYFVAGPLVLAVALGVSGARAQGAGPVVPAAVAASPQSPLVSPDGTAPLYYIDGQPADGKQGIEELTKDMVKLRILRGTQVQRALGPGITASRALLVTTEANQHRADVVAFNQKTDAAGALDTHFQLRPAVDPTTTQLPDGVRAYIAKTYPGSTIGGYFVADHASNKAPHIQYYASVTTSGGERHKLYFNAEEQPVAGPVPAASAAAPTSARPAPRGVGLSNGLSKPTPVVYLDGQRYSGDINDIGAKNIANVSVFKGDTKQAQQLFGADTGRGVVVVTSIAKQNDADVRAFNEKLGVGTEKSFVPSASPAPAPAPTSVPYLAAPALAYITQHYPAARLLGVAEVPAQDGGPTRYQAQIVIGRRPGYLLFDAAGQFISESYSSNGH